MAHRLHCLMGFHGHPKHVRKARGYIVGNCPDCWDELYSTDRVTWATLPQKMAMPAGSRMEPRLGRPEMAR
jgi:hypothetical protein